MFWFTKESLHKSHLFVNRTTLVMLCCLLLCAACEDNRKMWFLFTHPSYLYLIHSYLLNSFIHFISHSSTNSFFTVGINWKVLYWRVCWMLKSDIWTASFCLTDIHPIPLRLCVWYKSLYPPWASTGLELLVWRNVFWLLTRVSVQGQCISVLHVHSFISS